MNIIGEIEGRTCVIVDDIVDTAGTLCHAADALKARGAKRVLAYATHPVFSGNAVEKLQILLSMKWLLLIQFRFVKYALDCPKIRQLSCSSLLGETISRIACESSVSSLFAE